MGEHGWPTTVEKMRELDPEEFEHYVADLWAAQGWEVEVVQLSNDGGRDVVAKRDGERRVIQAKRYAESNYVGSEDIQQYSALLHDETVDSVSIVTTGRFTNSAYRRAQEMTADMDLIDGDRLEDLADRYSGHVRASSRSELVPEKDTNNGTTTATDSSATSSPAMPDAVVMVWIAGLVQIVGLAPVFAPGAIPVIGMDGGAYLFLLGWFLSPVFVAADVIKNASNKLVGLFIYPIGVLMIPVGGAILYGYLRWS
jgi:hypothetical protein